MNRSKETCSLLLVGLKLFLSDPASVWQPQRNGYSKSKSQAKMV
jgi:hypothetical protein